MVRMINLLCGTGKMVVTDSGLFLLEGLISMVEKDILGSALIKKWRYWPKGVPAEEILRHIKNKEVWDVDVVKCSIRGESYHIMTIKDTDNVILMMTTCGTLDHLEDLDTHRRYKRADGELVIK